jgi:tetratricopeptide (TPR) repeat protein
MSNELSAALELHQAGQLDAAAQIYSRLFESDRNNADACYGLGTVLMQTNNHLPATELLGRALTLEPDVPEFRHNYGLALKGLARDYGQKRDYPAAIKAYESFLQLKEPDSTELLAYADLLLLARDPDAARQAVDRAMEAGSDLSAAHLIAARCARLKGDYDEARDHIRTAIEKRPAFGEAWQLMLDIESQEELPGLASECARLAGDESDKLRNRVLLAMTSGRAYEKLKEYTLAFEQFLAGNNYQIADQASRDVRYDEAESQGLAARAIQTFQGAPDVSADVDPARQPIFIVGMPRSGTTLVERILGGLDGVVMGGESESMGVIASQFYWNLEQGNDSDRGDLAIDYWRRELCAPCRRTDKMPNNFWHIGLIAEMFPAAPIIYMQREPRDVCMSIFSRVFSDGHPYATRFESLAHFYRLSVDLMQHWIDAYPSRVIEVSYEELIDQPDTETQAIAEHCGLEWVPECLNFHERSGTSFTYSEMQVREPLNRKGIDAWRRYESQIGPLTDALREKGLLA